MKRRFALCWPRAPRILRGRRPEACPATNDLGVQNARHTRKSPDLFRPQHFFNHNSIRPGRADRSVGGDQPRLSRFPQESTEARRHLSHPRPQRSSGRLAGPRQAAPAQIVAIFEACLWIGSKGFEKEARPMSKGGTQRVGDFEVTMTHAFHSSAIEDNGVRVYAGEPGGYVIRMPGGFSLYHAGATAVFGDMKLIGELYRPDVACLPIGDLYTMGPREAAYAIRFLGVKHVVPMHYATFPVLTGTPEALRQETRDIAGLEIHVLKPGESLG